MDKWKAITYLPRLVAEGLLTDFIISRILPLGASAVLAFIVTWLGRQTSLSTYLVTILGVFIFFIGIQVTGIILGIIRVNKGVRLKFCTPNGIFTYKIPKAYYYREGNKIVYRIDGYARLANLTYQTRTVESVKAELKVKRKVLDSKLLAQFPIGKRLESLDTTKEPTPITIRLSADEFVLNELTHHNLNKARVNLIFEATGDTYSRKINVKFMTED